MRFDQVYRPKRFSEVFGQDRVVELLRSLIQRNKLERNLMVVGDRGSGKTSLARLYARALNCEQNESDGSPCGECGGCSDPDRDALFEYDTAGKGGDPYAVARFVYSAKHSERACRVRVLFFDEAHVLEDEAADALLKEIEEPKPGVVFCFATTAPGELRDALISRLMIFEVRALSNRVAIEFLRNIADRAELDCDPAALVTLAAAKRNYPRDLVIGLEQVFVEGRRLTVEDVKATFGIDQVDTLTRYFTALAAGEDGAATQILESWHDEPLQKADWVRNFVLSLYYNNVLGRDVVVDPLIYAEATQHHHIVEGFEKRLMPEDDAMLTSFWLGLVRFWASHKPIDHSSALLTIALFQSVVISGSEYRPNELQRAISSAPFDPNTLLPNDGETESSNSMLDDGVPPEFVGPNDVKTIIRRASEFVQHTGQLFNVSLRVHPSARADENEEQALGELREFVSLLEGKCSETTSDNVAQFAAITLFESGDQGYFAVVAAFVPGLNTRSGAEAFISSLNEAKNHCGAELYIDCRFASNDAKRDLEFHWNALLDLCASAYEPGLDARPGEKGLLDRLKLPASQRREPRPLIAPRIRYSSAVSEEKLRQAQAFGMTFLSAIDDEAYQWIKNGWERDEHSHRMATTVERRTKIEEIRLIYDDPKLREEAEQKALMNWGVNAKRRAGRTWKVWWRS